MDTSSNALFIGKFYHYLGIVSSTNDYLVNLIKTKKVPEGAVVVAGHQTAGKGQRGNVWLDEAGSNIAMSLYLKPQFLPLTRQFYLSMSVALGISQCIIELLDMQIFIKWPNDILLKDHKICGVLIENSSSGKNLQESVIGIGLNVNQVVFPPLLTQASSLKLLTQQHFDLDKIIQKLFVYIEKYYLWLREGKYRALKEAYLNNLYRFEEKHAFQTKEGIIEGRIIGVDAWGHLVIEKVNGKQATFGVKEISFYI